MHYCEQIQTFAELAIAIAGFAGIAFVLGKSSSSEIADFRVTNLLALSIVTMISCCLSLVLGTSMESDILFGRASAAILLVLVGSLTSFYSFPRYFSLKIPNRSRLARIISRIAFPMLVGNLVLCLVNTLVGLGRYSASAYLFALAVMLIACAIQFMALIVDREEAGIPD
jgi:hypothetical protein